MFELYFCAPSFPVFFKLVDFVTLRILLELLPTRDKISEDYLALEYYS